MAHGRLAVLATTALISLMGLVLGAVPAAAAGPAPNTVVLPQSAPAASPGSRLEATPSSMPIEFDVGLELSDPAGAVALQRAVSDPSSASYRHYLTPAQWERRFSPSKASVEAVTGWLQSQGVAVEAVSSDRLTVQATASAATIERAFGTSLAQYSRDGQVLRSSTGALSVPATIAPLIAGVSGVDQRPQAPRRLTGASLPARKQTPAAPRASMPLAKKAPEEIPQPEGFRNAPPCSPSYGKASDMSDPEYGGGFPSPLPYAVCGYTPPQLQGAYGLSAPIAGGLDGHGYTVAVVDAYVSPTLLADAQQYATRNQPSQPLSSAQYSQLLASKFNSAAFCEASGWFGEQTLDVEAVHATAPGAKILYVGAKNCETALYRSVQQVVDGHLADVITNSWGDGGGDLLDSPGSRRAFDNILLMAGATGIGVQFSSGDEGDEFTTLGMTVADYPAASPYATSVGGTSLQVGEAGERLGELGWSTSRSYLCTALLHEEGLPGCNKKRFDTWTPKAPGEYLYGGGGGTSYEYSEPWYQEGVVPAPLAQRNSAVTGIANRVEPDISMDGDPTTGMLVGETQTFPDGTYYDEYRIGGTSLSSPLLAGVMADADQAAGASLGFVNPLLYELYASPGGAAAYYDVQPGGKQANVRGDFLDEVDAEEGILTSARVLGYEGREKFCSGSGSGNCTHQKVALNAAPGFDSMTGLGTPTGALLGALAATP
jgi:subtilase family serine protease